MTEGYKVASSILKKEGNKLKSQRGYLRRLIFLFVTLVLFAPGCASKPSMGQWEINLDVTKIFETGKALPDHTYYYYGSSQVPIAIIAIDNRCKLRDGMVWAKVEGPPDEMLKKWLNAYRTEGDMRGFYSGGVILAPNGQRVGIWYSLATSNLVEMTEPGVLTVYQPTDM